MVGVTVGDYSRYLRGSLTSPFDQYGRFYRCCARVSRRSPRENTALTQYLRPTVAGISGNAEEGAWSVALSGGYADESVYRISSLTAGTDC
jgi:hypothetical protein